MDGGSSSTEKIPDSITEKEYKNNKSKNGWNFNFKINIPEGVNEIDEDCFDKKKWQSSLRKLWRGNILNKDSLIRISFAYLFRIQVDGKYFLVKNGRGTQKYQPVGGAYKYNKVEKRILSSEFQIVYDKNEKIYRKIAWKERV